MESSKITRRELIKNLGMSVAATTLPRLSLGADRTETAKPNFVFILADDQGWTGTSVQMHDAIPESKSDFYRTPNLERLARQGMRFSQAYAPSPMCCPTRCSILTGKSPAQLHMTTVILGPDVTAADGYKLIPPKRARSIPASETTIADMLKRESYATAHFGKWHLASGGPGRHGFDEHDGSTGNEGPGLLKDPNPKDIFGITSRGVAFMEKHVRARRPFYLQLSHYAVHGPILSRTSTAEACKRRRKGRNHFSAEYAASTEDLDAGLGMILDKIDRLGIADNTYVIYMSDNGPSARGPDASSNRPLAGGKGMLWEGGIRVPFIIRGPRIKPNVFSHTPAVGYDLLPTISELAGVSEPLPHGVEGGSLVPLFRNDGRGDVRRPHDGLVFHFPNYGRGPGAKPQSAILLGDHKLIKLYETGELLLFDLSKDIGEKRDRAKEMPGKAAELERRLNEYLKAMNAGMPTENPAYDPSKTSTRRRSPGRTPDTAHSFKGPLAQNDKNRDGKISRNEAPLRLRTRFDQIDVNGDGFIEPTEMREYHRRTGRGDRGRGGRRR